VDLGNDKTIWDNFTMDMDSYAIIKKIIQGPNLKRHDYLVVLHGRRQQRVGAEPRHGTAMRGRGGDGHGRANHAGTVHGHVLVAGMHKGIGLGQSMAMAESPEETQAQARA